MYEINIRTKGAKGDNATDDWAIIQGAINDAARQTARGGKEWSLGGARVILPAGTYLIKRPLVLPGGENSAHGSGGGVHLIGHPGGTILHGHDNEFPKYRGLVEWNLSPLPAATPIADLKTGRSNDWFWNELTNHQDKVEGLFRRLAPGLPSGVDLYPLDGKGIAPAPGVKKLPRLTQLKTSARADFQGIKELLKEMEAWSDKIKKYFAGGTYKRGTGKAKAYKGVPAGLPDQRISGIRFYLPEHSPSYALNRRWPLPVAPPDALVYLTLYLEACARALERNAGPQGAHFASDVKNWLKRAKALIAKWTGELGKPSVEGSRIGLRLEDVEADCNNRMHAAVFKFDASVYRSSFRNITVQASNGLYVGDTKPNGPRPNRFTLHPWLPKPPDPLLPPHNPTKPHPLLKLSPKKKGEPLRFTDCDTVAFLFEHRTLNYDANGDSIGFQNGVISNVTVANRAGGHNCCIRGRVANSSLQTLFANRAMFGPGLHLIRSFDNSLDFIHSEGGTSHPEILFDQCVGLRMRGFGLGDSAPEKHSTVTQKPGWRKEAQSAGTRFSCGLVLRDTHDCTIEDRHVAENQFGALASRAIQRAISSNGVSYRYPDTKVFKASKSFPPGLVQIESGSRRNRISGLRFTLGQDMLDILEKALKQAPPDREEEAVRTAFADTVEREIRLQSLGDWNEVSGAMLVPQWAVARLTPQALNKTPQDPIARILQILGQGDPAPFGIGFAIGGPLPDHQIARCEVRVALLSATVSSHDIGDDWKFAIELGSGKNAQLMTTGETTKRRPLRPFITTWNTLVPVRLRVKGTEVDPVYDDIGFGALTVWVACSDVKGPSRAKQTEELKFNVTEKRFGTVTVTCKFEFEAVRK